MLSDGNWLEDSRHAHAAPAFGFLNGTSVISSYAVNKEYFFGLNRELTKQRHELRYQGVEGSLDHRKDKGKPELVPSELDRLHPISAACLQTSATQSACLTNGLMLGYCLASDLSASSQLCHCKHAGLTNWSHIPCR